jgi:hypothetical protein
MYCTDTVEAIIMDTTVITVNKAIMDIQDTTVVEEISGIKSTAGIMAHHGHRLSRTLWTSEKKL